MAFLALLADGVRFKFGKTSLASSGYFVVLTDSSVVERCEK